jgi:hypothetical protein
MGIGFQPDYSAYNFFLAAFVSLSHSLFLCNPFNSLSLWLSLCNPFNYSDGKI